MDSVYLVWCLLGNAYYSVFYSLFWNPYSYILKVIIPTTHTVTKQCLLKHSYINYRKPCRTCTTVGSDMSVSAFNTSTTASATTAVFMHAISKPYTSSQNAMRSRCLSVSPTATRLMLQRSGYTNEGEQKTTLKTSNPGKNRSQTDINLQNTGDKNTHRPIQILSLLVSLQHRYFFKNLVVYFLLTKHLEKFLFCLFQASSLLLLMSKQRNVQIPHP